VMEPQLEKMVQLKLAQTYGLRVGGQKAGARVGFEPTNGGWQFCGQGAK